MNDLRSQRQCCGTMVRGKVLETKNKKKKTEIREVHANNSAATTRTRVNDIL